MRKLLISRRWLISVGIGLYVLALTPFVLAGFGVLHATAIERDWRAAVQTDLASQQSAVKVLGSALPLMAKNPITRGIEPRERVKYEQAKDQLALDNFELSSGAQPAETSSIIQTWLFGLVLNGIFLTVVSWIAAGSLASERAGNTLETLVARAPARWSPAAAKWLATTSVGAVLLLASMVVLVGIWFLAGGRWSDLEANIAVAQGPGQGAIAVPAWGWCLVALGSSVAVLFCQVAFATLVSSLTRRSSTALGIVLVAMASGVALGVAGQSINLPWALPSWSQWINLVWLINLVPATLLTTPDVIVNQVPHGLQMVEGEVAFSLVAFLLLSLMAVSVNMRRSPALR